MKDYQVYANNYKDKSKLERDLRLCNLESVTHFVRSLTLFTGQNVHANSGRMLSKVRLWWCRRYWLSEIELGKFHRSLVRRDFAEKRREQNFLPCITALWFWILQIKTFFFLSELSQYLPSFLSPNWLVGCYAIVTKMMMIEERPKFMNEIMSLEKQIALSTYSDIQRQQKKISRKVDECRICPWSLHPAPIGRPRVSEVACIET